MVKVRGTAYYKASKTTHITVRGKRYSFVNLYSNKASADNAAKELRYSVSKNDRKVTFTAIVRKVPGGYATYVVSRYSFVNFYNNKASADNAAKELRYSVSKK